MDDLKKAWNIYESSFPEEERRSIELHQEILKKPHYNFEPLYDEENVVGILATWEFEDFIFNEHFAVDPKLRGKGYGSKLLKSFLDRIIKKMVLEVEMPDTEVAKRRIKFYQGLNIHLNDYPYIQPSYGEGKESVPMMIMTYPDPIDEEEFNKIKDKLYKEVYLMEDKN